MKTPGLLAVIIAMLSRLVSAGDAVPAFPLKVSDNGRHLVDDAGQPFFFHADTVWLLPRNATLAVAEEFMDQQMKDGFTAVHFHVVSKEVGPVKNVNGDEPFAPLDNILKPNETYWRHLDSILAAAEKRGLAVAISALWIQGWRGQLTDDNARVYGQFLGSRCAEHKNLIWILGGDANPGEKRAAVALLAQGIKDKAPHHLLTVHNAPENSSAAFFGSEPWLDLNAAYTYREVHPHVLAEWNRPYPDHRPRPVFLIESGYERESNDKRPGDAGRMRRQAYGSVLNGALAGHAYGHRELWKFSPQWREAAKDPGYRQMRHVRDLFATRAWWKLAPEQRDELVTSGRGKPGDVNYVSAARAADGSFALIYLPDARPLSVDIRRLASPVKASWFDPTDGSVTPIDGSPFANTSAHDFASPMKNAANETDWVLILEASR